MTSAGICVPVCLTIDLLICLCFPWCRLVCVFVTVGVVAVVVKIADIHDMLGDKVYLYHAIFARLSCPVAHTAFRRTSSVPQRKLREIQDHCWDHLVKRTYLCAVTGYSRRLYKILETV